jgi:tRNA(Ile)-lysidine synthase
LIADVQVVFERKLVAACAALTQRCNDIRRLVVAYSGGWDSSALLYGLARSRDPESLTLNAIHVDHGLHARSSSWADYCRVQCDSLRIPLQVIKLTTHANPGESVEAWARDARYTALREAVGENDLVLTAHHRDDQAETFLFNALRGAGPDGLQGIAPLRPLGRAWLGRPCLSFPGAELRSYSESLGLSCIEDPSNDDPRLDRNYLRQMVMPLIKARWPSAATTLARAAALQRTAATTLDAQAEAYLRDTGYHNSDSLPLDAISRLADDWQAICLRHWIAMRGYPTPTFAHLERMLNCVVAARGDSLPKVEWHRSGIRRYRDRLYLYPVSHDKDQSSVPVPWDFRTPLALPSGVLSASHVIGAGIRAVAGVEQAVSIRARRGGERCRPVGRAHSQTLKRLFQERQIPPWDRVNLPLVYVGESLAAVGDLWVCAEFAAGIAEPGWRLRWDPHAAAS